MRTKPKAVADQMSPEIEEGARDQEEGEAQGAVDLVAVRVDMRTREEKIDECVHQGEEVEAVVIVIEEGEATQDQNQDRSQNQTALDLPAINDGLMTNTIKIDIIDQGLTGTSVMKDAIQGTGIEIEAIEIIEMREIVIDQEIEEETEEAHKQEECADGKMRTTKHQIANYSEEQASPKSQLIKNQSKVLSPSTKEQRESRAKNEIIAENLTENL